MTVALMLLQYTYMKKFMKKLPSIRLPRIKKPNWNYKKLAVRISIIAALLLVTSSYVAYKRLYLTNERRFWIAMNNNLSTKSVVQTVESGGTGNKDIEKTRFNFGIEASIDKISTVSSKTATTLSNVSTRTITTPSAQYVSYLNIDTSEVKADGSSYDFSSVKGVWAKMTDAANNEEKDNLLLNYIQPHVTVLPFSNLDAGTRSSFIKEIRSSGAYEINFADSTVIEKDGKKYIAYPVNIQLKKYVSLLQKNFNLMGYGTFPALDTERYKEGSHYSATILVDPSSNNFYSVQTDNQVETYGNYGVFSRAPVPQNYLTMAELQEKLQKLQ